MVCLVNCVLFVCVCVLPHVCVLRFVFVPGYWLFVLCCRLYDVPCGLFDVFDVLFAECCLFVIVLSCGLCSFLFKPVSLVVCCMLCVACCYVCGLLYVVCSVLLIACLC